MAPEAIRANRHNIFTPGNYFYNGVGHVTVKYWEVLKLVRIMAKAQKELDNCNVGDGDYARKSHFLDDNLNNQAVMDYADRYAQLAREMAGQTSDPVRRQELLVIAENCSKVPAGVPGASMKHAVFLVCTAVDSDDPADILFHRDVLTRKYIIL